MTTSVRRGPLHQQSEAFSELSLAEVGTKLRLFTEVVDMCSDGHTPSMNVVSCVILPALSSFMSYITTPFCVFGSMQEDLWSTLEAVDMLTTCTGKPGYIVNL